MAADRKGHHGPSTFDGKSQVDYVSRPAWYTEHVESIPNEGRHLLEVYSGIPPERVLPHVVAIVRSPLRHIALSFSNADVSGIRLSIFGHTHVSAKFDFLISPCRSCHTGLVFCHGSRQGRHLLKQVAVLVKRFASWYSKKA